MWSLRQLDSVDENGNVGRQVEKHIAGAQDKHREFFYQGVGARLRVKVTPGNPQSTPLLLCSGFGVSCDALESVVDVLGESTVIRFDAPGIGGSVKAGYWYRFNALANILCALLDELGYQTVDVLGISWGGMLAQEFTLSHPERCRKLILVSTLTGHVSVPATLMSSGLLNPNKWRKRDRFSRFASLVYGGNIPRALWRELTQQWRIHQISVLGGLAQVGAIPGWTSIHRLHRIKQPVLLMFGNDDAVIPLVNANIFQSLIPHAQLRIFDGGHLFPWTCRERLQREISSFRAPLIRRNQHE